MTAAGTVSGMPVDAAPLDATRELSRLATLITGGDTLVLTGAGISTGSGIPDYRGPTGTHRGDRPITLPEFMSSSLVQQMYWARSHIGWERFRKAAPNAAHRAVTALEHAGALTHVVTQNVDGLHHAAGTTHVTELHGRLNTVICMDCGTVSARERLAVRLAAANPQFHAEISAPSQALRPDGDIQLHADDVAGFRLVACEACGGVLKPNVVMFGEHIPGRRYQDALQHINDARALLVLGSSLAVGSGYRFVLNAVKRGIPVAIVTRGVTRGDRHAAITIDADLCALLPALVNTVTDSK